MMVTLSELQMKEVVMMHNGKRLGQIADLEIDDESGFIKSVIIMDRQGKGALFQKAAELEIRWQQIMTIGADIILVQEEVIQNQSTLEEK